MSYLPSTTTGRQLVNAASASAGRTVLGLGTIATQDSDNVAITGGTISGITLIGLEDVRTVSANTTLDPNDKVVGVSASGADVTITLYPATGSGRCYIIKNAVGSTNNVIVAGDTSGTADLIDGAATFTLAIAGESITVVDVAANTWMIV